MSGRDRVFDVFRNCLTDSCEKCQYACKRICTCKSQSVSIPKVLALDVLEMLNDSLNIVHCKDCKFANEVHEFILTEYQCHRNGIVHQEYFYCADGEREEEE